MTINEHLEEYAGLPVFAHGADATGEGETPAPGEVAWCVAETGGPAFRTAFESFVKTVDTAEVTALVIGFWDMEPFPVRVLTDAAASFPNLKSLFIGDIVLEEAELSWIMHTDLTPVLRAFPGLERLDVRGAEDLVLYPFRSESLKVLRFESAGLPAEVVRAVAASELPNLEHLDLWLGIGERGGDATVADVQPFLAGARFPSLRHIGLQNTPMLDELADAIGSAPVVPRLESLALSLGVLTDRGAEALLSGQPLTHLRKLDLRHHYLSDAMVARTKAALPGVDIDFDFTGESMADRSEELGDHENRDFFIAVSE
ncbi:cytoplasmic protein [Actinomadura sp. CNU-125]|uniref:STM4015 family protein n=1 Tax=Actinomadura sp. CNU-125 TaxID=1904961 RepID=UPI00095B7A1C|nr:STM4015 family protein [Actinomadura sp. CNU-125]OLT25106.1 cytoplasmic protein [Actinomadura sp. CNU-125]